MATVATILGGIAGLGSLICFILVLVKMFQTGNMGLGIACIVLTCCGIGPLIAFIYGWVKARDWNIMNLMIAWTVCVALGLLAGVMNPELYTAQFEMIQQRAPAP
jgi:hypothetical protein